MLGVWRRHTEFQDFLVENLSPRWEVDRSRITFYANLIEAAWLLDLDSAQPILAPFYSAVGRPSNQAPEVLRTLILMTLAGETSIPMWRARIQAEPILAIACGYPPEATPGIATLYDFFHRFWCGSLGPAIRRSLRSDNRKPGPDRKLPNRRQGVAGRLLKQVKKGRRFHNRPERVIQMLMASTVVEPSAARNLLGDTSRLRLAADGAPLETGGSSRGTRTCKCHEQGVYRCNCPRKYHDAEANRGYDSHHKRYFYGHTLYHVTAADSPHDLPVYVRLTQGNRHDSSTGMISLVETLDRYPEFRITTALLDSAHDNTATYELCYREGIAPYIDVNQRSEKKDDDGPRNPIGVTSDGTPICAAGHTMKYNGFNPGRARTKFRCPLVASGTGTCSCSDSDYGRVVYTYPDASRREPPVPRDSKAWKDTYKRRTAVERSLKRTLVDYSVEHTRVRGRCHWYWRTTLAAMAQHVDAWLVHARELGREPLHWLRQTFQPAVT